MKTLRRQREPRVRSPVACDQIIARIRQHPDRARVLLRRVHRRQHRVPDIRLRQPTRARPPKLPRRPQLRRPRRQPRRRDLVQLTLLVGVESQFLR